MRKRIAALLLVLLAPSCTDNQVARRLGGTSEVELPPGQKVVMTTWKGDGLWILTRPMQPRERPELFTFHEHSNWGFVEGTMRLVERSARVVPDDEAAVTFGEFALGDDDAHDPAVGAEARAGR